jgi:hypothetical protein
MKKKLTFVFDYVFPTFILPNALDTQMGIINYISSVHTNRTLHYCNKKSKFAAELQNIDRYLTI